MHKLLKFEGKKQPLLDQRLYYNRVLRSILAGGLVITFFLLLGVVGYHFTCAFGWLDSLLNASMILSGMGPVTTIETNSGKWFAAFYALVSGALYSLPLLVLFSHLWRTGSFIVFIWTTKTNGHRRYLSFESAFESD